MPASTRVITAVGDAPPHDPSAWLHFGADLGFAVPESGTFAPLALALLGLASRFRSR